MHIEDQAGAKRCGHRPGKSIVSAQEMCDRIKALLMQDMTIIFRLWQEQIQ